MEIKKPHDAKLDMKDQSTQLVLRVLTFAFFAEAAFFWVRQRGIYEGLNLPASMLSPDIGLDALVAPLISLIDRLVAPDSFWKTLALGGAAFLVLAREVISLNQIWFNSIIGPRGRPTKYELARRVLLLAFLFIYASPITNPLIVISSLSFAFFMLPEKTDSVYASILPVVLMVFFFKSIASEARKEGLDMAGKCYTPVVVEIKTTEKEYMSGCWIAATTHQVVIKPQTVLTGKTNSAIILKRDEIISYSFLEGM